MQFEFSLNGDAGALRVRALSTRLMLGASLDAAEYDGIECLRGHIYVDAGQAIMDDGCVIIDKELA